MIVTSVYARPIAFALSRWAEFRDVTRLTRPMPSPGLSIDLLLAYPLTIDLHRVLSAKREHVLLPFLMTADLLSWHTLLMAVAVVASVGVGVRLTRPTRKRLVFGSSELNDFIAEGLRPIVDQYKPVWWTNTHIQILLTFLVPHPPVQYTREILGLDDGGQVALDWAVGTGSSSSSSPSPIGAKLEGDAPVVIVFHGLTGCSDAMRSLCAEALRAGYRPVVFNKRGHGGVKLTTPTLQAFGCIRDLKQVITRIEDAFPLATLYGIGLSAGSGLLCSYLGETGTASRLAAGVLISPGYDALELFCRGNISRVYDFLMTFSLKQLLLQHQHELQHVVDVSAALKATCVREFDEHVYMKLHGYDDIERYWIHNNPLRDVTQIARPVLCINALDDPVCTKENIAYEIFENDPQRILIETEHGSHCAFYQGHWRLKSWSDGAAIAYLNRLRVFEGKRE